MSESPKLSSPPPIDFVNGPLGDDQLRHKAFTLYTTATARKTHMFTPNVMTRTSKDNVKITLPKSIRLKPNDYLCYPVTSVPSLSRLTHATVALLPSSGPPLSLFRNSPLLQPTGAPPPLRPSNSRAPDNPFYLKPARSLPSKRQRLPKFKSFPWRNTRFPSVALALERDARAPLLAPVALHCYCHYCFPQSLRLHYHYSLRVHSQPHSVLYSYYPTPQLSIWHTKISYSFPHTTCFPTYLLLLIVLAPSNSFSYCCYYHCAPLTPATRMRFSLHPRHIHIRMSRTPSPHYLLNFEYQTLLTHSLHSSLYHEALPDSHRVHQVSTALPCLSKSQNPNPRIRVHTFTHYSTRYCVPSPPSNRLHITQTPCYRNKLVKLVSLLNTSILKSTLHFLPIPIARSFTTYDHTSLTYLTKPSSHPTRLRNHSFHSSQKRENTRHASNNSCLSYHDRSRVSTPERYTHHEASLTQPQTFASAMSVFSSISAYSAFPSTAQEHAHAYLQPLINEKPESTPNTSILLMGWIRTVTPINADDEVPIVITNGISGLTVEITSTKVFLATAKVSPTPDNPLSLPSQLHSKYKGHHNYRLIGIQAKLPEATLKWPITRVHFSMQTSAHYYCHPVSGTILNSFNTPSVEYIAILPSLMEYRSAYDIACDFFTCIANIIKLSATDYIIAPGPPAAPDTPTRTFCLVTRSPLEESTKRAILSIAKSLRPYSDNSDLDQNGRTYLRVQFDLTQIKLFSGSDNLTKLNNIIRGDLTAYLWVLVKSSPVDVTPEILEEFTNTTVDSWFHITKYGEYIAVLAPTEDPCRLTDGHPQIHVIKTADTSCVWTILPKGFPNEYQPGRGRIESYFGSSPPHFIYYIPPSADPAHVRPEHYVYMPEPLRTTLFIHQTLRLPAPLITLNANIAQNLPTTKTPRRNSKGLQLPTSSPPHADHDNNAPPSPPIQHKMPPAPQMRRHQESPQHDRFDQSGHHVNERLSHLENFVKSLPPIRDSFQDLYNRLDLLPNQLSAELHSNNDATNSRINALHDAIVSAHDELTHLRTTMSTHLNYLYFFNNANPHDHLPPLPPVEDEYQHVFATGKIEFSPFKVPNTNILPMDSLPSSAIRNLFVPPIICTLPNHSAQAPPRSTPESPERRRKLPARSNLEQDFNYAQSE